MATEQADKAEMEDQAHQRQQVEAEDDVLAIDLPAPQGWTKKFYPNRRNEIIFISPTGGEIKNKKQLDQYRKSHPGSPPSSEFDWGTGDTPRRSARLSGKAKARETPQSNSSQKRQKKSSSKKTATEENADTDGEMVSTEAVEKTKDTMEVKMKDAEVEAKGDETKDSDWKTEEKADDAAKEKSEHVDGENLPEKEQLLENNTGEETQDKPDGKETDSEKKIPDIKEENPDENKAEAEEKQSDVPAEPDSYMEQRDAKEATEAEKEMETQTVEQKEVTKEMAKSGDIGLENNGHEEAQNEPNAPPSSS